MGRHDHQGVAAQIQRRLERRVEADAAIEVPPGTLRGLGELRPASVPPPGFVLGAEAEAAFAVEKAFRRNGLGQALFRRIAAAARNRGVRDLHVRCLAWNRPMR